MNNHIKILIFVLYACLGSNLWGQVNQLNSYEYWFNNDFESKVIQNITPVSIHELSTSINVTSLPDGVNVLHFRYRDNNDIYSATLRKLFVKFPPSPSGNNKLAQYEYWFNNDFSGKTVQAITPTALHEFSAALDVNALPDGVNVLHLRYLDERGYYSAILRKLFVKFPPSPSGNNKLVQYEYWFNNDFSGKTVQAITPTALHEFSAALDVNALPDGVNVLHLRYLDERGYYGSALTKIFVKHSVNTISDNQLKGYKYWFDSAITAEVYTELNPAEDIVLLESDWALPTDMVGGDHQVYVQFLDLKNRWSVPYETTFAKSFDPRGDISVDNNPACSGNMLQFTAENLIDVNQISWDFGDGSPASNVQNPTHVYAAAGNYTVTATLTHTDSSTNNTETINLVVNPSYNAHYYYLNDDFENDPVGSLPDTWVIRYNGTGTANQKVVDNPVKNGVRAFQLEGAGNWAAQLDFTLPELPNQYSVEMWIQAEKVLSGGTGGFMLFNTANSWGSDVIRVDFYNGNITVFNRVGSTLGTRYTLQSYVPGQWYHIKAVTDFNNYTCKIYIDGVQATGTDGTNTVSEFPMLTTLSPLYLTLVAGNSGTTKMFFDDVKIYQLHNPQPAVDLAVCADAVPYTFGTQQLSTTGTYDENFYTEQGCDSIVQLNFTVKPLVVKPTLSAVNTEVCAGANASFTISNYNADYVYEVIPAQGVSVNGSTVTAPIGSYTLTAHYDGCSSEVSEVMQITEYFIDKTISIQDYPLLLTANQTGATYQWIDCTNGNIPINGATQISYEPTVNGDYAVQITQNGCMVTSDCVTISTVNIADYEIKELVKMYPNPANTFVNFNTDISIEVSIYNATGAIIWKGNFDKGINTFDINNLSSGLYLTKITAQEGAWENQSAVYRLIKD
jgi:PKD repeat protein/uncharacterized protein YeaC (DUF1315 family)